MSFSLKGKTMAEATEMLNNAFDKSDTGEQVIKGITKIQDDLGNPIEVVDDNQVITKLYINNLMKRYSIINLNIPFNIDKEAILSVYSSDGTQTFFSCKCGKTTQIKGIILPSNQIYIFSYISMNTRIQSTLTAEVGSSAVHEFTMSVTADITNISYTTYTNVSGYYCGGMHVCGDKKYYYAFISNGTSALFTPTTNYLEMFVLGAGSGNGSSYTSNVSQCVGGRKKTYSLTNLNRHEDVSVVIGGTGLTDSCVVINNTEYGSSSGDSCGGETNGIKPFSDNCFEQLFGAGAKGETGGGKDVFGEYNAKFYGASGYYVNNARGSGAQGIVILRWEVSE